MAQTLRLVVEAIDPETECIAADLVFEVHDVRDLCDELEMSIEDYVPGATYDLDLEDIYRLRARFKLPFEVKNSIRFSIRPWRRTDALPYKIHTNRELALMLSGSKPLAVFVSDYPGEPGLEVIPERLFAPYVKSGRFVSKECIEVQRDEAGREREIRRVMYALPEQAWRMDMYALIYQISQKSGWHEGFERLEGALLGYEEWQIEAFISLTYASQSTEVTRG